MTFQVTSLYAAALGILTIILSFHVILYRAKSGVSLLDGTDTSLTERIRRHGNFTEYVPIALILIAMAEANGIKAPWLHTLGAALLIGRLIHPFGIKHDNATAPARIIGTSMTQLVILAAAILLVWQQFAS